MKIAEIIAALETVAPLAWQESYDNAGVQVGDITAEATAALLCLDVTEAVVDEAVAVGANVIISHHPLLFKGLKSITGKSYIERVLMKAIQHHIVIYASHTNMDNACHGVNYKIAEKLGLSSCRILEPLQNRLLKLVTYVPEASAGLLRNALFQAGAGHVGNYDRCSYTVSGKGTFRPGDGARPFCGEAGREHTEEEARIEVILPDYRKTAVIAALLAAHPYEEPAFDIFRTETPCPVAGSGVVGDLPAGTDAVDFLKGVKTLFGAGCIRHTAVPGKKVRRIALCGGSGSFLIPAAIASGADMFLTGEIKYHDYFGYENRIILAELGHYESEQYTKDIFCDIITKKFPTFAVHYTKVDTNPINYL
ncbi:MAG: Nif3-like dinuclear metal center hexameric protein [Coprobacter sp.]|nr:Nif3-like dinuclear metal center hexameric protein [Coprobacter sp.]